MNVIWGVLLVASSALAEIEELSPVAISKNMKSWDAAILMSGRKRVEQGALSVTGYTQCAETTELAGAFLCGSYKQNDMNLAFTRASVFVEGLENNPAGTVVRHDNSDYLSVLRFIGGHDLRARDLMRFYHAAEQACDDSNRDAMVCLSAHEEELFEQFVLPHAKANPEFVVITWASISGMSWRDVVTHEVMHAQYFLDSDFMRIVDEFWEKTVTAKDKIGVTQTLIRAGYGVEQDALLLRNEFQAYILMYGANGAWLKAWVPAYRDPLFTALRAGGVTPIQVQVN